jgi:hypothetical protein
MYTNLHSASTPLGSFSSDLYWSSSEYDAFGTAWAQTFSFSVAFQGDALKSTQYAVRPVRAF